MSNIVKTEANLPIWEKAGVPSEIWSAMKSSLYPGAKEESILMVWEYCKAKKLDPMQKPVHIVPMWIVDAKTKQGEMRDVIMPGIITNRIQASRSGIHAGTSEPEFGPDITKKLGMIEFTYPEWCRIIVKKVVNGHIVEYPAKEYWIENYATAGKDKAEPNAMWKKRPYAQLAKCTEAQALRKAFPDHVDQNYTAEEMEGKALENVTPQASKASQLADIISAPIPVVEPANDSIVNTEIAHTEPKDFFEMVAELKELVTMYEIPGETVNKWLEKAEASCFEEMPDEAVRKCIAYVKEKHA